MRKGSLYLHAHQACNNLPTDQLHPCRAWMENTSSTGIEKGLSSARCGVGTYESTASISSRILAFPSASFSPLSAASALPRTMGMSSPGNLHVRHMHA